MYNEKSSLAIYVRLHLAAIINSFSICDTHVRTVTKASRLIFCKNIQVISITPRLINTLTVRFSNGHAS